MNLPNYNPPNRNLTEEKKNGIKVYISGWFIYLSFVFFDALI